MEGKLPVLYGDDAVEIPGARDLVRSVTEHHVPWAIVTSGTSPLVNGWMSVLNMTIPEHLVAAEDVQDGKPDPTCYLMGKQKLGIQDAANVLVLEDSPAGIQAGKAAGCRVLAVVTSHPAEQVASAEPDWIVKDLESVKIIQGSEKGVELEISNILDAKKVRAA
jgi:glycerol 3-phosphatase-1